MELLLIGKVVGMEVPLDRLLAALSRPEVGLLSARGELSCEEDTEPSTFVTTSPLQSHKREMRGGARQQLEKVCH